MSNECCSTDEKDVQKHKVVDKIEQNKEKDHDHDQDHENGKEHEQAYELFLFLLICSFPRLKVTFTS